MWAKRVPLRQLSNSLRGTRAGARCFSSLSIAMGPLLLLLLIGSFAVVSFTTTAGPNRSHALRQSMTSRGGKDIISSSNSYCGIMSVYAASRLLNHKVEFGELLKPEFVGDPTGSSIGELRMAAAACDMHSTLIIGDDPTVLEACSYPVILYVKRDVSGDRYDHFILFSGNAHDGLRFIDPEKGRVILSGGELSQVWGGIGLVLSNEPPALAFPRMASFAASLLWLIVIAAIIAIASMFSRRSN